MSKLEPVIVQKPKTHNLQLHDNALINEILQYRNISSKNELLLNPNDLLDINTLRGTKEAAKIIAESIQNNERIIIVGDYDCDGATSTATMVKGLKLLGAKDVRFVIPNREKHGYGLTPPVVELAGEQEPDLIITVDNGIAAFAGVDAVKKLKKPCKIIVTDHHLMPDAGEPVTDATINPQHHDCKFKSKNIAGCGVAFYTIAATRQYMRENGWFENKEAPQIIPLLEYVALGTVADVVTLDHNNRILVELGLQRIRSGFACPGIMALVNVINKEPSKIYSSDFGFGIGPRLNAAGRLEDMTIGIQCLLSEDFDEALEIAKHLDSLNQTRKEIESDMTTSALEQINLGSMTTQKGVCLYNRDWHEGVIGILASRIKERLARPVIVFTNTAELNEKSKAFRSAETQEEKDRIFKEAGELFVKGSARSINAIHIKHTLDKISKETDCLLASKFGGHHMAAGLSVQFKHLKDFEAQFDKYVSEELNDNDINGIIEVDIKNLPSHHISITNAETIKNLLPWGAGFEEPIFSSRFEVKSIRIMKEKHMRLELAPTDNPRVTFTGVMFNCIEDEIVPTEVGHMIEVSFKMDVNEWRDTKSVQLMLNSLKDETTKHINETESESIIHNEITSEATSSVLNGVNSKRKK